MSTCFPCHAGQAQYEVSSNAMSSAAHTGQLPLPLPLPARFVRKQASCRCPARLSMTGVKSACPASPPAASASACLQCNRQAEQGQRWSGTGCGCRRKEGRFACNAPRQAAAPAPKLVSRAAGSSRSNENAKIPTAAPTIAEQEADCFRLPPVALRLKLTPDLTLQLSCNTEVRMRDQVMGRCIA